MELLHLYTLETTEDFNTDRALKILGLDLDINKKTKEYILNEISLYIFENTNIAPSKEKIFDYNLDYKYYYCDFKDIGIDLNKDNISWWEFDTLLQGIFLKEKTVIGKVIEYRTYKKPTKNQKTAQVEEHKYYMERKRQFALPQKKQNIDDNFNKMWNYVSTKTKKGE